jgi:hypothetical protein
MTPVRLVRLEPIAAGQLLGEPLLDAAVDGDMFRAHRMCLDLEWQSWQREPTNKASQELLRD